MPWMFHLGLSGLGFQVQLEHSDLQNIDRKDKNTPHSWVVMKNMDLYYH